MSKNVWGRERKRTWVSGGEFRRDGSCCLWDQAGTKAGTERKSVYMCQKYYWFDKSTQTLLMHNLKRSVAVEIPLPGFSFWEEDEERLWDGSNQDMGEWEGSAGLSSISCILTQPQMCSSVSPRRPQCRTWQQDRKLRGDESDTAVPLCTNPLEGKPQSKK